MNEEITLSDREREIIYKPEELRLLCRNCNTEWIEERPIGHCVRYEKDNNYLIKRGGSYQNRKFFTCPKCHAHSKIARLPS
jgi:hypothetical protein